MDCETARLWLEARRQDPDPQDALPEEVAEHVARCENCRSAQHLIAVLDPPVARRLRNVAVPEGLQARLLQRLASSDAHDAGESLQPPPLENTAVAERRASALKLRPRKWIGRRTLWIGAAGSAAAAAALLVVALLGRAPRWSTAEVRQLVRDVAFDSLEAPLRQDAALPLKLPVALRRNEFLRAGEKLLDGQRIVVLHYRVPGTLDTCEVYVIPSAMLSESVPVFSNMLLTTDAGRTLAIWRENDHVFAFVYNGAGGEDVLQRLRPSPELT